MTMLMIASRKGRFQRTLRNEKGEPLLDSDGQPRVIVFHGGEPQEVTDEEYEALLPDVGKALVVVQVKPGSAPRPVVETVEETSDPAPVHAPPDVDATKSEASGDSSTEEPPAPGDEPPKDDTPKKGRARFGSGK